MRVHDCNNKVPYRSKGNMFAPSPSTSCGTISFYSKTEDLIMPAHLQSYTPTHLHLISLRAPTHSNREGLSALPAKT